MNKTQWRNQITVSSTSTGKVTSESQRTTGATDVYNAILFKRIKPEIEKIFQKIKAVFEETDSDYPPNKWKSTWKKKKKLRQHSCS